MFKCSKIRLWTQVMFVCFFGCCDNDSSIGQREARHCPPVLSAPLLIWAGGTDVCWGVPFPIMPFMERLLSMEPRATKYREGVAQCGPCRGSSEYKWVRRDTSTPPGLHTEDPAPRSWSGEYPLRWPGLGENKGWRNWSGPEDLLRTFTAAFLLRFKHFPTTYSKLNLWSVCGFSRVVFKDSL